MKKLLLYIIPLLFSLASYGQTKQDSTINSRVPATGANSTNTTTNKQLNPVLLESLGNRVISFGSTPTMTTDSLFFANVKVKFGNSSVITVSGSVAIVAPDADPANYRVDFFVVKRNGTVRVITGTPGVQGITPIYDPNSEVVVFWWLINNTGTGTVTPVTYATLTQTRAGVATDLAINPYTFITVTQEMIDEALAGITAGGGHVLKYNSSTLTPRATLQVLSDDQGTLDDLRDSSAANSTILDLTNYIPYGGNDRYWRGDYRVGKPDGTEGLYLFSDDKPTTGVHFEHLLRNDAILYGVYRFGTNRGSSIDLSYSRVLIKSGSTNSGIHPATSILLDSTVVSIQADLGARYFIQPFPVDSITASTRWDKAIPSVKILKDYVSAYGGSGATTQSLTPGYGIAGSPFNGSTARTWDVDTTDVATHPWVEGLLSGFSPEVQALKTIITRTSVDYLDGQVLDVNLALYNTSTSPGLPAWVVSNGSDEGDGTFKFTLTKFGHFQTGSPLYYDFTLSLPLAANTTYYASATEPGSLTASSTSGIEVLRTLSSGTDIEMRPRYVTASVTTDAIPTNGSTNPVQSDGVFDALALKQDASTATTLTGSQTLTNKTLTSPVINSPTGIVKGDVGLGNVDNTSDATKNAATVTLTNKTLTSPVINSGSLGSSTVANTQSAGDNSTKVATTAYVDVAGAGKEPTIATGTSIQYWNGAKSFVNFGNSVRNAYVAQSLSLSNTAIVATDSVSVAFGKAQGQINANATNIALKVDKEDFTTLSISSGTATWTTTGKQSPLAKLTGITQDFTLALGTVKSGSQAYIEFTKGDATDRTITLDAGYTHKVRETIAGALATTTITTFILTGASGTITGASYIANGTTLTWIFDQAAAAVTSLPSGTAGQAIIYNSGNVGTATSLTGDVTVNSSGVTAIGANKVTSAMLASSLALAGNPTTPSITVTSAASSNPYAQFNDPDVTLPNLTTLSLTPALTSNTTGQVMSWSGSLGGTLFYGLNHGTGSAAIPPMALVGQHGTTTPTVGMVFDMYKWNGSTSRAALASTEVGYNFRNGGTDIITILGNGRIGVGQSPSYLFDATESNTSASRISVANTNTGTTAQALLQAYNGTATATIGIVSTGFTTASRLAAGDAYIQTTTATANFQIRNTGTGDALIDLNGAERFRFKASGKLGIGVSSPTGLLHLAAGTATANTAPLKFNSGTNLTTPEAGAVEFDGTNYFATSSTTRYTLAKTLTNTATLDFASTASGVVTDLTVTVTGAADGDAVSIGVPNASQTATGRFFAWVSSANTVTIRYSTLATEDPASGSFRVSVIKY